MYLFILHTNHGVSSILSFHPSPNALADFQEAIPHTKLPCSALITHREEASPTSTWFNYSFFIFFHFFWFSRQGLSM